MNWQTFSVQRLKAYEARVKATDSIPERIKMLELEYGAIKAGIGDGMPKASGGNKAEDQLVGNIAKRAELENNLEIARREIELTEKGLAVLDDEEKRVLYVFFINRPQRHVELLCEELHIEKSKLYQLKDEALKKFTMACYGVVDL
jgi:DNA-directed RNA polymerase specialized sigma subunit